MNENNIIKEGEVRDGLYQVAYSNGLTLSVNSGNGRKVCGVPVYVEVAVMHTRDGGFIPLSDCDDVANISIEKLETLHEKMSRLPVGEGDAAQELWHWAEF